MALPLSLLVVSCLLSLGAAGVALWCALVLRDSPGRRGAAQLNALSEIVDRIHHDWVVAKTDLETLHDQVLNGLESVEKKRRQAAASASRAKGGNAERAPDLTDTAVLRELARSRGMID